VRWGLALALAILGVGAGAAGPLAGQERDRAGTPEALAAAVAAAWGSGDADGVAAHLDRAGVALEFPGSSNPAVPPTQARAALARLLGRHRTRRVDVVEVRRLGGAPERGMARLVWQVSSGQTPRALPLFLALEARPAGWIITELRLIRGAVPDPAIPTPQP
jgi:hypothetical protein